MRFLVLTLLLFISGCQTDDFKVLNNKGQQSTQEVNNEMDKLNQALLAATRQGDKELITKLLTDGADIDVTDNEGRTPALIAVHTNQLDIFKLLLEKGANINIRDNRSDNPLLYAGAEGMLDFVKVSIAAGADTSIVNRFGGPHSSLLQTVVMWILWKNFLQVLTSILIMSIIWVGLHY